MKNFAKSKKFLYSAIIAILAVITTAIGVFGYNKYQEEYKQETIEKSLDKIGTLKNNFDKSHSEPEKLAVLKTVEDEFEKYKKSEETYGEVTTKYQHIINEIKESLKKDAAKKAEEQKKLEAAKKAEEQKKLEAAKKAEEQKKLEAAKKAEEEKKVVASSSQKSKISNKPSTKSSISHNKPSTRKPSSKKPVPKKPSSHKKSSDPSWVKPGWIKCIYELDNNGKKIPGSGMYYYRDGTVIGDGGKLVWNLNDYR